MVQTDEAVKFSVTLVGTVHIEAKNLPRQCGSKLALLWQQ
jgi:hypothetical protein